MKILRNKETAVCQSKTLQVAVLVKFKIESSLNTLIKAKSFKTTTSIYREIRTIKQSLHSITMYGAYNL